MKIVNTGCQILPETALLSLADWAPHEIVKTPIVRPPGLF